jgi:3-phenylpropionate/trans-cinnamate dioxygenase ferredoxin reductase subunit
MPQHIVIIGAGLCGGRAALTLREKGFAGDITLIGDEPLAPYDRPPLSKQTPNEGIALNLVAGVEIYTDARIRLMTGISVCRIDRAEHRVILEDGRDLAYDKLLISTGARARTFGASGQFQHLLTLRTHADASAIRERIGPGRRLVVIGGGFIGLELAASARQCGAEVTVIEGLPRLMARAVPAEIASVVAARHRQAGVEILLDSKMFDIVEDEKTITVNLANGRCITANVAVAGVGAVPNIALAEDAGLAIDNGIAVDSFLATSDPDIFAAGDCCSFPLSMDGGRRVRLESWRSAQNQGILAASNLMGAKEPMTDVPWFWSDQYDLTLQIAGLAGDATMTIRRQLDADTFILFHLDRDGRLIAASGIGKGNAVARDIRLAEMLIAARAHPNIDALSAPEIRLKTLLSA